MTEASMDIHPETTSDRKRRLVLMGEFSAGKSTLTNILLDKTPLPMRVTATRLPPVQISYGKPAAFAIGYNGESTEIALDKISDVPFDDTLMVNVYMESDVLQLCDLVDMPGISDPNMRQDIWENIIEPDDNVIWCTHATQAWRQSEAAIWKVLSERVSHENLLIITQFDKLQNERDKKRVLKRVEHETEGLFDAIYPVSLLDALNSDEDPEVWEASGAAALSEHVIRILMDGETALPRMPEDINEIVHNDLRNTAALRERAESEQTALMNKKPILPRRVMSGSRNANRLRSARDEPQSMQG
jgi:hypothetical protein